MKIINPCRSYKFASVMLIAAATATLSALPASANDRGTIRFAKGKNTMTTTATVRPGNVDCWVFRANEGQRVAVRVSDAKAQTRVLVDAGALGLDYGNLEDEVASEGARSYTTALNFGGDHPVCVATVGRAATYRFTITIV